MSLPARLGKYDILRELGQGAMGIVYEGRDPVIDRRVAIKTLKREQLERSEADDVIARFKREAQAAGRLNHPNVVAIYEYGEADDGTAFIAMEFVQGRELKDLFEADERIPLPMVGRLMGQLLDALGHAHRHGVTHRDIKPANIILLADNTVKVADFGVARIESSNLTQTGTVIGTPSYMSPEQFMGQTVDGRSDLFSAGVVLYQLLTGEKPFTGALTTIMHKVLKEDPTWPSVLNVHVNARLDAVVRKALAKRPDDRFQDAAAFRAALDAALLASADDDATVVTLSGDDDATLVTQADATLATPTPTPTPVDRAPAVDSPPRAHPVNTPARRGPLPFAIAAAALVAVSAGVWFALQPTADAPAPPVAVEVAPPAAASAALVPAPSAVPERALDPGVTVISAIGLADPSDPRFANDQAALAGALRDDARRQILEKAVALFVDPKSVNSHYALLQDKLLGRSGDFIQAVLEEAPPELGKDGLMAGAVRAAVRVRQVQKSLNQMSEDERVDFIRNNGDPKISVAVASRWADGDPSAPAQRSPLAENMLKQHVQGFGFRTWNDDAGSQQAADFSIDGEVRFKRLSATLAASGLTIEKVVLTSWTVRCTDRKTGEEVYLNTEIPEGASWASEEKALADIGKRVGEQFSRDFFLSHFHFAGRKVRLDIAGLPGQDTAQALLREIASMRAVLGTEVLRMDAAGAALNADMSGGLAETSQNVQAGILLPLSRKLGRNCLRIVSSSPEAVALEFEAACREPSVLARLETLPPAALMDAAPARREAVVRDPELLKRISI